MFLEDARNTRARLVRAEAASAGIEEAEALASKGEELLALAARVVTLGQRARLLRKENVPLTDLPDIDKTRQVITQIAARFAESPKATTLVDKQRWSKLVATLTEFAASAETLQKQDWKAYFVGRLFAGLAPEQRKQTILQALPENRNAMERYTDYYQRFNQYRNTVPASDEELRNVHAWSKALAEIKFVENADVPDAIKAFFNATSTVTGASLNYLTTEVIEWLRTNNMLANYVVRAR